MSWPRVRLGDVAELRNGMNFVESESGVSVAMVGVGDFMSRETITGTTPLSRIHIGAAPRPEDLLQPDDLLFVRSNGSRALVGRCVVFEGETNSVAHSGFTIRARIDQTRAHPIYVAAAVRSGRFRSYLKQLGSGSSISNLSQHALADFGIALPSLAEQSKIAEILRTWDDAIETTLRDRESRIAFRGWLRTKVVGGNLHGDHHANRWHRVRLGDVVTEHGAQSDGTEEVFSVSVHKGLVNQVEHLGRSFAAAQTRHYNRVFPGDLVYTKSPTGDFPFGVVKQSTASEPVIVSPLYGVFTPQSRELGVIIDARFESPLVARNYLGPLVQKGAKNTIAITNRRFLEGSMWLPADPAEITLISRAIETSREEITLLDRKLDLLRTQKRGLAERLLSGDLRVHIPDVGTPDAEE